MKFELQKSIAILERTPTVLRALLADLPPGWTETDGDAGNWQAFDVVGHLIHGEKTDWIPRAEIILRERGDRRFVPFDRLAQFDESEGRTLDELLCEFEELRLSSLSTLASWRLTPAKLNLTGIHPELGEVTLEQLLATWVVHDLNHIRQIVTAMAARYEAEVGPWRQYLSILNASSR
jgi:hypothetical protein